MAFRDKNDGETRLRKKLKNITRKDFGADDNDGKDAHTWQNREKDWFNSERRFIFAADTKRKRHHWIEQFTKMF